MDLEEDNDFKLQEFNYTPTENRYLNFPNKLPENNICKHY